MDCMTISDSLSATHGDQPALVGMQRVIEPDPCCACLTSTTTVHQTDSSASVVFAWILRVPLPPMAVVEARAILEPHTRRLLLDTYGALKQYYHPRSRLRRLPPSDWCRRLCSRIHCAHRSSMVSCPLMPLKRFLSPRTLTIAIVVPVRDCFLDCEKLTCMRLELVRC
ncbi:hypothetical protein BDV19DRAFT_197881 [Aspergillus venezuelensis]